MTALLKAGMHPDASDQLRTTRIGREPWRISQTIGHATASAGTHDKDGTAGGKAYSAATDLSIKDLSRDAIKDLLHELAGAGFACWARIPGENHWPANEAFHAHIVYVGCPMKAALRRQVEDWLQGRNGLQSHANYTFMTWTAEERGFVRRLYVAGDIAKLKPEKKEEDEMKPVKIKIDGTPTVKLYNEYDGVLDEENGVTYINLRVPIRSVVPEKSSLSWDKNRNVLTVSLPD